MTSEKSSTAATEPTATVPLSTVFCANDADVVIRAAGTRDFRVHKLILSLASPVFRDMFTLPQPASDTLPNVDVQESPETWSNILHTIYPTLNPTIDDLDSLESLLLAAKKYEMQSIIDTHKKAFENREFIKEDPLYLYAIACACGFEDQAKYVARNADFLTVIRRPRDGTDTLNGVTVASYRRLITFLVERDTELRLIFEEGWRSFESECSCLEGTHYFYEETRERLSTPYLQMKEVYFSALKDRPFFYDKGCSSLKCAIRAMEIFGFLERMFAQRERVCDKFMWEQ